MKFEKEHYNDILKALAAQGLSKSDFQFVKRRGRIIMEYKLAEQSFSYFRDRSMHIDEVSGAFARKESWEIKKNGKKCESVLSWVEVLSTLTQWLSNLKRL